MLRLDYPGVGPEHSFLKDVGRAEYFSVTDDEALEGMWNETLAVVSPLPAMLYEVCPSVLMIICTLRLLSIGGNVRRWLRVLVEFDRMWSDPHSHDQSYSADRVCSSVCNACKLAKSKIVCRSFGTGLAHL